MDRLIDPLLDQAVDPPSISISAAIWSRQSGLPLTTFFIATPREPSTGLCFSSQPPRANPPQVFIWSKIALHKHFTLFYSVFTPCSIGQSSSRIFDSHTNPFGTTLPLTNIISLYVPSSRCKGRTNQTFQKTPPPQKAPKR
ncbi:hypothetical protein PCANC_15257 [Puccinia coronata f. sp. avenae]|uniref:Uncharacterized protein n=1 Tax=Puccinia coronata f. sp. avenae TaxID=200324 RepID=A0A2N5UIH8_9BASI|nr:hypothetical protein PCANC_15257 [Puccinia coronata f. sp. avenae]